MDTIFYLYDLVQGIFIAVNHNSVYNWVCLDLFAYYIFNIILEMIDLAPV
jgi:hypothetical protein